MRRRPPRRLHQLDYVAQFATDIRYIAGTENIPADTLSRIDAINLVPMELYEEMAEAQRNDPEMLTFRDSRDTGLELKDVEIGP
jgi:hypothetical protein